MLKGCAYLGLGSVVRRDCPQPGVKLTLGDGADAYAGLGRFGRVVDQQWYRSADGGTYADRFRYAYDRSSNRLSRVVTATGAPSTHDEAYGYDSLDRLTRVNRGALVSGTISDVNATWSQSWGMDELGNWDSFVTDANGGTAGGSSTQARAHNRRWCGPSPATKTRGGVGHAAQPGEARL